MAEEPIQTYGQWTVYVNKIAGNLRTTSDSINDTNDKLQNGTPRQALARQHAQNSRSLRSIEGQIQTARSSLGILQQEHQIPPQQFASSERRLNALTAQLNDAKSKLNVNDQQPAGQTYSTEENENTQGRTNQELMQMQDETIARQDALAMNLHNQVRQEIGKAREISDELDAQDQQMDQVNNKMEKENVRIQKANKKIIYLTKQSACISYIIIAILLIILVVQVSTKNFTLGFK